MLTFIEKTNGRKALYQCECGNKKEYFIANVDRGHTKSCGCLRKQVTKDRSMTHGHKSGGKRTKVYAAWVNMKSRCNNPNLKNAKDYIGRGIAYCDRWESFENFLDDMGEPENNKASIDRINNDLGYSKENCRWANPVIQNNNKRTNVRYEFSGKLQTLVEWSKELGIGAITLHKRLQRGVDITTAFTTKGYINDKRDLTYYEYNGKSMLISEWAKEYSICESTLERRIKKGMTIELALFTPLQKKNSIRKNYKLYEYNGKSQTIPEWANELGIERHTLAKRLAKGIDIATAFTTKGYLKQA